MEKNTILILTNSKDGEHTDSVIKKLSALNTRFFRLNIDEIASGKTKVDFIYTNNETTLCFNDGKEVCFKDVASVWYRRPNELFLNIKDSEQKAFAEDEIRCFLEGLWLSLSSDVYWMNNFANLEKARRKVYQLHIAKQTGFSIPDTIVSNNSKNITDFFHRCKEKMIFKTLSRGFIKKEDKSLNIPTTFITRNIMKSINLANTIPALFQCYVEKDYEIRITIVGEKIFSAKISSQDYPETTVDWRHPDFIPKLRYSIIELPSQVEKLCLKLMKRLGLGFGAIDMIVDKDGNYVFLEINPNGQWYWIEAITGSDISGEIANTLTKPIERR